MSPQTSRIAHYQLTSKLGEGGMGAVYRATDTKLNRDVAVKVLPEAFASDGDRLARFTREAQVLASLNHPNIAAIYGVEDRALVLELVDGAEPKGPMTEDAALPLIHQLIDALEYAHEKGIVHRDLKPANLKVTSDGRLKVLDFGLAKAMSTETSAGNPVVSPTLTMRETLAGVIMGTAAYMAPEQARGAVVDHRADVWAFGVVVYELLTGQTLFEAPTVSDTLAGVLRQEIDIGAAPARFRRLLRACLERDVKKRLRHIGDARLLLEGETSTVAQTPRRSAMPWVAAVAVLLLALCATGFMWWRASRPVERPVIRLSADLGAEAVAGINVTAAISPDGTRMVFPLRGPDGLIHLGLRYLDQSKTTVLPGTENASDPFFSPDSQSVGFVAGGKLKKMLLQGGSPVTLCRASDLRGASWGEDGYIVATLTSSASGLSRVSANGGAVEPLTKPTGGSDFTHRWPQILPGGEYVLFTSSSPANFESGTVEVVSLKTGKRTSLHHGGYFGRYLPSGHVVYIHERTLYGVRFDLASGKVSGAPVPLIEDLSPNDVTGAGQFDFSRTGAFVYYSGAANQYLLSWMDGAGKMEPILRTPGSYIGAKVSPDGGRVVLGRVAAAPNDLWSYDWQRDKLLRLTFTGNLNRFPVWAPDGKHILLAAASLGKSILGWVRSDGASSDIYTVMESGETMIPNSMTPDGRRIGYTVSALNTGYDLWTAPLDMSDAEHPKAGKPEPFLNTAADERFLAFSPDGRWIAYDSTESGTPEVYVRPFPGPGGKWQVSSGGGQFPLWSRKANELFYLGLDDRVMAAGYTATADSFDAGKPRLWSPAPIFNVSPMIPTFDVTSDGKRFAVLGGMSSAGNVHVSFLLNFLDEVRRKLP